MEQRRPDWHIRWPYVAMVVAVCVGVAILLSDWQYGLGLFVLIAAAIAALYALSRVEDRLIYGKHPPPRSPSSDDHWLVSLAWVVWSAAGGAVLIVLDNPLLLDFAVIFILALGLGLWRVLHSD